MIERLFRSIGSALLAIVLAVLLGKGCAAVVNNARGQEPPKSITEWSPHFPFKIDTTVDHTGPNVIRYKMPKRIWMGFQGMLWTSATNGNLDRPEAHWSIPIVHDAHADPPTWGYVEMPWITRQPLAGGGLRYTQTFPTDTVNQWRIQVPEKPGYSIWWDFSELPNRIKLLTRMSQIDFLDIGSDITPGHGTLRIGHQKVSAGPDFVFDLRPGAESIRLGRNWTVEKNGELYLKVKPAGVGGKTYGIKLEPLP